MRADSVSDVTRPLRDWRLVVGFIAAAWTGALAYSTVTGRALYADGAWALLHLLINPLRFNDYDFQRSFAVFIIQGPILFGQRLGLESLGGYAALLSLGPFVLPAIAMVVALWLSRHQPGLFAANAVAIVVFGFGANFVITEANLLFGFVWLSITIMALGGVAPILRGFALPFLAFLLLRVYEGMLLVGPILAFWALVAAGRAQTPREQVGLSLAALLYLVAAVIGVGAFLSPRDPGNAANFRGTALFFLRNPQAFLLLSALLAIPAVFLPLRRVAVACKAASAVCASAFIVALLRLQGFYAHDVYYQNRSFLVFSLPAFVLAALAVYALRPAWLDRRPPRGAAFLLVPFAFAVAGDLVGTYRWSSYIEAFCGVLDSPLKPAQRLEKLKETGVKTAWPWTHPSLSVLLRSRGSKAMVVNEAGKGWEPFEPERAPTLDRAGICQAPLLGNQRDDNADIAISFQHGRYPSHVAGVSGLSDPEGWGTWSQGPKVEIRFARRLPRSFDLAVSIATAIGDNRQMPVRVTAGSAERSFVVEKLPFEVTLEFRDVGETDVVTFHVPRPQAPSELGMGPDSRRLGIGLVSVTMTPK